MQRLTEQLYMTLEGPSRSQVSIDVSVSMATYVTKGVTFFFFSELLKTIPERGRKKKWKNGHRFLM
jgi:hypothetical protein